MGQGLKRKMVHLLGKLTSVMVGLQPKKIRNNLDNFVRQANNELASMRENVIKEVRGANREATGERLTSISPGTKDTEANTCQKGPKANVHKVDRDNFSNNPLDLLT